MNEVTTIDMPGAALAVIPASQVSTIIAADPNDILGKLAAKVKAHKPDVSTKRGRDEIRSLAAEIASNKSSLIKIGKGLTEEWRQSTKAVNAECNVLEERMDALKEQVRAPLTAFENAEKNRVAGHEAALTEIENWSVFPGEWTSEQIANHYERCKGHAHNTRIWQEFDAKAQHYLAGSLNALDRMYARKLKEEADAAELERLRLADADRQRQETVRLAAERDRQIAVEAAETARKAAEAEAHRLAAEERTRVERERQEAAETLRRTEAAKVEAERVAAQVEAREEIKRQEGHRDALATMRKLATALTPPDSMPVIRAKIAQLDDVFNRQWDEFAGEAASLLAECEMTLDQQMREAQALADQAEAARINAQIQAQEAAAAEATRLEQERVAAKAAADKADADRRAENVAHRRRINGESLTGIVAAMAEHDAITPGNAEDIAKSIIKAVAKGEVKHMTITY